MHAFKNYQQTERPMEEKMKGLWFRPNYKLQSGICGMKYQRISPKWTILCLLAALLCLFSISSADNGLIGKWRAVDQNNTIYGFGYIPELKFAEDGTLYAGITYGYRILDDSKFVWEMGHGIERIYKYEITGDLLMIYALQACSDRARFKRVR
jgi:hypothetical protein